MMDVLDYVISPDKKEYKCYGILRDLFLNNKEFRKIVTQGIIGGKIRGFSDELWQKLDSQLIRARGVDSFVEVFRDGANLGYCTVAAKQVSYSLNSCYICGGVVDYLVGTVNSLDGSHTWIECGNEIIDTTLVLMFDKELAEKLGYHEENRYDPNIDPIYVAQKEFANATDIKKK